MSKQYPISEVFGPTIQGEGPMAGTRTFFIRFAGCDWDCGWCDTQYAVNPKYPGWQRMLMDVDEIITKLRELGADGSGDGDWLTLSGGNPALFVDEAFVERLRDASGYRLAMETQGSRALDISVSLGIGCLVVSPKPPSSGMHERYDFNTTYGLLKRRQGIQSTTALKFVVFDQNDLEWISQRNLELFYAGITNEVARRYLSVGTPAIELALLGGTKVAIARAREAVCDRYAWLCNVTANDPRFHSYTVIPQLHTLAWGVKKGV